MTLQPQLQPRPYFDSKEKRNAVMNLLTREMGQITPDNYTSFSILKHKELDEYKMLIYDGNVTCAPVHTTTNDVRFKSDQNGFCYAYIEYGSIYENYSYVYHHKTKLKAEGLPYC